MTEAELYKELGLLNRDKDRWKEAIPYVSSLLSHDSVKIHHAMLSGDLLCVKTHSYNCFETVVLPERPAARALMEHMTQSGAVFARMSGSGPSVVGYFDDSTKASDCADALLARGIRAYLTKPLR